MNRKIYISYDYNDNILAVVLSPDREKASIAFTAGKFPPHRIEEIDPNVKIGGVEGVVFLLSKAESHSGKTFIKRGF